MREFCAETGQPEPPDTPTLLRVILESLAQSYTLVVDELAAITGRPVEQIHIVGGGVNNELLCQLTADISGRQVVAGPVEATALGNVLVQARAAGELADLAELRRVVAESFPLERFEPRRSDLGFIPSPLVGEG